MQEKLQQCPGAVAEAVKMSSHFLVQHTAHIRSRIMSSTIQRELDTFCQKQIKKNLINHLACDAKSVFFLPNKDPHLELSTVGEREGVVKYERVERNSVFRVSDAEMLCMALHGPIWL